MSDLKVNKVSPIGTAFQLGESGDTITIPSGATILNSGTATNFGDTLPAYGADGNVLTSTGSAWASEAAAAAGWTQLATQATTSGTEIRFPAGSDSFPAGVKRITILLDRVSQTGVGSPLRILLGHAGGYIASG